jgi:hypothetical protein
MPKSLQLLVKEHPHNNLAVQTKFSGKETEKLRFCSLGGYSLFG